MGRAVWGVLYKWVRLCGECWISGSSCVGSGGIGHECEFQFEGGRGIVWMVI